MELKKILMGLEGLKSKGNLDIEVNAVKSDSREIQENDMFVCIRGFKTDGHNYIDSVVEKGAKIIMIEEGYDIKTLKLPEDVTLIVSPNTRYSLAICSANFHKNPSEKVKLIGITGTKGKTTTSYMIKKILEEAGKKVGLIGTIANYIGNEKISDSSMTTPESTQLQELLSRMVKENVDIVIMEVSSQSLKLDRVAGCKFDIGIFTNFSRDHIGEGEHESVEEYFNSKKKLFQMCEKAFINTDDLYGNILIPSVECPVTTYGIDNSPEVCAKDIIINKEYVDFRLKINNVQERVRINIPGRFTVYNTLAAILVSLQLEANAEHIKKALENIQIPGRSELVPNDKGITIMIDYAHTPDSLQNILKATKVYTKGRIITVFGCGGNRDRAKRAEMGKVSGNFAGFTIITSDNPRKENPQEIINDIEEGIKSVTDKYICIVDRTEAIKHALDMVRKDDIVILAGKGHETYQILNNETIEYDERLIVKQILDGE